MDRPDAGAAALRGRRHRADNRLLSISPDVEDPAARSITFEELRAAYAEQVRGLVEGGVDLLLVETIIDALNAKAAIAAIDDVAVETGVRPPVMISVTITDRGGRTLAGQTIEAFWITIAYARPPAWASTAPSAPPRCGPTSPSWRAWPTAGPPATRMPACPTCSASTTSCPSARPPSSASSPRAAS